MLIATFGTLCVLTVVVRFIMELKVEEKSQSRRDLMMEELCFTKRKRVVIQGMFKKHNQAFRDGGLNGPKGSA